MLLNNKIINYLNKNKRVICIFFILLILLLLFILCNSKNHIKCFIIITLFLIFCFLIYINTYIIKNLLKINNYFHKKEIYKLKNIYSKDICKLKKKHFIQISKNQKFSQFGKMSAELFHELANPLTSLNLNIEACKRKIISTPSLKKFSTNIDQATNTCKKISELITIIRKQVNDRDIKTNFSLNKEIENAISMLKFKSLKNRVTLIFQADEEIKLHGNSTDFFRVCLNIISNGIDTYPNFNPCFFENIYNKRVVEISIKKDDKIRIYFKDYGKGIKIKNINKIFTPFFSTKKPESGTGLGLYISQKIINNEFNGKITVYSKEGQGCLFQIII